MSRAHDDDDGSFELWRHANSDTWDSHYLGRPLPQPAPPTMAELLKGQAVSARVLIFTKRYTLRRRLRDFAAAYWWLPFFVWGAYGLWWMARHG